MIDQSPESPTKLLVWIIVSVGTVCIGTIATLHSRGNGEKDGKLDRLEQMEKKLETMQKSNEDLTRANRELGDLLSQEKAARNQQSHAAAPTLNQPTVSTPAPPPAAASESSSKAEMDRLRAEYEARKKVTDKQNEEAKREAMQKAIAGSPWCNRCSHYHPIDPRGCPTAPGTHKVCGTKHWLDEVCPLYGFRIPPPGSAQ